MDGDGFVLLSLLVTFPKLEALLDGGTTVSLAFALKDSKEVTVFLSRISNHSVAAA
jgi:hypothetical protein